MGRRLASAKQRNGKSHRRVSDTTAAAIVRPLLYQLGQARALELKEQITAAIEAAEARGWCDARSGRSDSEEAAARSRV